MKSKMSAILLFKHIVRKDIVGIHLGMFKLLSGTILAFNDQNSSFSSKLEVLLTIRQ